MARTILITGCSSGIGQDAALNLHKAGWRVFATCRKLEDVQALQEQGIYALVLDYADPDSVAEAIAQVAGQTGGTLDALFNNGASCIPGPLEDLSRAAMEATFQTNFLGWHDLTQRAIPLMRAAGGGRIVMCSSVLGLVSPPLRGSYNSTKFAIEGYADALRIEMAEANIHVILIEPGPIKTQFRQNAIAQFEQWVDWRRSARAAQYETHLLDKLYKGSGGSRFEKPPSAVTEKLRIALTAKRPAARYMVTKPTYFMAALKRVLPASVLDRLLARS